MKHLDDLDKTVVSIKDLQRTLDSQCVIKQINAEIKAGDVIGLLGKNGVGKTTLLETLLGFGLPSFGEITIYGEPSRDMSSYTKQRIGFVPQKDELLPSLNAKEHLALYKKMRSQWDQPLVERLCVDWDIPPNKMAQKMSVGQRQKLSIILALAHKPDLLILDEPVAALDPSARRQFIQQLVEVASESQRSIVFSSHIVSDMERIASKIWLMYEGHLIWQESLDALKESVVRLNIYAKEALSSLDFIAGLLHAEVRGAAGSIVVKDWNEARLAELKRQLNAKVTVEYLGLEDIFLHLTQSQADSSHNGIGW